MPMTIADPEELRRFSGLLDSYVKNLERETNRVSAGFGKLRETWRDQKAAGFEQRLRELLSALNSFKENTDELIPYLCAMAQKLEDYHNS